MEQSQECRQANAKVLAGKVLTEAVSQAKQLFKKVRKRNGPRYVAAIAAVAFLGFLSPLPGTWLLAVAVIVAVGEIHRAILRRGIRQKNQRR